MTDHVGQQFGNYRLTRLLSRGGFAEVYLGEHIHLGTQAAVKILHAQLNDENIEQFRTEARTIADLDHPNIVRLLDFDIKENTPFLIMSYAPYGTLRDLHPKGTRLPLPTIVTYVKQIAAALYYAHEHMLIHRDIKPENMLLGRNNEVLLSDFGLALMSQSSGTQPTREMAGTVLYTAPEQLQGKPRKASDQYSLGIVVYEWLSGQCPFRGSVFDVATQHMLVSPPSLREKDPTIPVAVEEVVLIALAKDPQKRFAHVQAFVTALEQATHDEVRRLPVEKPTTRDTLLPSEQPLSESIYWTRRADPLESTTADLATVQQVEQADTPDNGQREIPGPALQHTPSQTVFLFNEQLADPGEFYGRVRERETLLNRTRKGASTSIVGPRRIGKTWFMSYLRLVVPAILGSRFRTGYLDATTASCATVTGFTSRVLDELGIHQFVPDSANRALTLLERVIYDLKSKGQQALLCIDEFEGFSKHQEFNLDFFSSLRGMTQAGLSLVVASRSPLIDIVGDDGNTSGFFNVFEQLTLEPFSLEEAQEFAQAKSKQAGFTDTECGYLLKYGKTGSDQWSPLRLQLVGKMLQEDKLLAQREGPQYYRPNDSSYWQRFEQQLEAKYRSVVR